MRPGTDSDRGANLWHHSEWPLERVVAERRRSISVCLPARDEVETIGPIVKTLAPLIEAEAIDQLVVVDDSDDGTGELAAELGAEVYSQSELRAEFGPVEGKGDAMWRALEVLSGEVVCYLDADSEQFGPHFALGLIGPAACMEGIRFVKGFYRRPFRANGVVLPSDPAALYASLEAVEEPDETMAFVDYYRPGEPYPNRGHVLALGLTAPANGREYGLEDAFVAREVERVSRVIGLPKPATEYFGEHEILHPRYFGAWGSAG